MRKEPHSTLQITRGLLYQIAYELYEKVKESSLNLKKKLYVYIYK